MLGMLAAETAILVHFKSVRIVLLVFDCVIVALLTFSAGKSDFNSHRISSRKVLFYRTPSALLGILGRTKKEPLQCEVDSIITYYSKKCKCYFKIFLFFWRMRKNPHPPS